MFKLVFLPNRVSAGMVRNAPAKATQLIIMGNIFYIWGNICPTIYPEYAIIVFIPTICWDIDK
jgi:hypothetical protein